MTVPAGAFDSYEAVGNREDLSDIIYNIAPTDTPFQMMAGRGKASHRLHEWQTDTLAAAAANVNVEGDDPVGTNLAATVRIGNLTQISDKVVIITGTQESIDHAGRRSELAYQLAKAGRELKRDMEFEICGNHAAVAGDAATVARQMGNLRAWYTTNTSLATVGTPGVNGGHASPGVIAAATDGTARALTESLLKVVIQAVWTSGGDPTVLMPGPFNKTVISSFFGNTAAVLASSQQGFRRTISSQEGVLNTAVDVYKSDFGTHNVMPNRFSRDRDLHVLTPRLWSIDYLRGFRQQALAKTGDSEKRQLIVEYTLRSSNQAGSGVVADLLTA